jgi:hypothetical protein
VTEKGRGSQRGPQSPIPQPPFGVEIQAHNDHNVAVVILFDNNSSDFVFGSKD